MMEEAIMRCGWFVYFIAASAILFAGAFALIVYDIHKTHYSDKGD